MPLWDERASIEALLLPTSAARSIESSAVRGFDEVAAQIVFLVLMGDGENVVSGKELRVGIRHDEVLATSDSRNGRVRRQLDFGNGTVRHR